MTYFPDDRAVTDGILQWFSAICAVPHGSGNEQALSDLLRDRFSSLGWTVMQDEHGNLRADIPATAGLEQQLPVVLQGHLDMVCAVAEGSDYDPLTSPVTMVVEGDMLRSDRRSSLGADNGLAIAMAAWLMTTDLPHGPVRLVLTTREETGMIGARLLDPSWLAGCRCLLNLDAAHFGTAIIGCAGGRRDSFTKPISYAAPTGTKAFSLSVGGLVGGHSSGYDALLQGNAIKLLSGFLLGLQGTVDYELAQFRGGCAQNAIPTDAAAVVVVRDGQALTEAVQAYGAELRQFCRKTDPDVTFTAEEIPLPDKVWSVETTQVALDLTTLTFHGIRSMHPTTPKLPSASCNLGLLLNREDLLEAVTYTRCTSAFDEKQMGLQHRRTAALCSFCLHTDSHSGWDGDPDSDLVRLAKQVFTKEFGQELEVCAVHAGLEPGVLSGHNPDLTMISIGPDIHDLHSTQERAELPSLVQFARFVAALLTALSCEK